MKIKQLFTAAAMAATLGLASGASAGTVVFYDNFDGENGGAGQLNYTGFANWTVSDGTVDLIGNGSFDFLPGNGLYVDMDGSTGDAGKMTLSPGIMLPAGWYEISFDLAGNQRNDADEKVTSTVLLTGMASLSEMISLPQDAPFTTYTRLLKLTMPHQLQLVFNGAGGDKVGMLLDNVKITAVPTPAAAGAGLALLGVFAARRKRQIA